MKPRKTVDKFNSIKADFRSISESLENAGDIIATKNIIANNNKIDCVWVCSKNLMNELKLIEILEKLDIKQEEKHEIKNIKELLKNALRILLNCQYQFLPEARKMIYHSANRFNNLSN